ncbi:MAG: hypothetical protein ABJF86_02005 [Tateyamaria sp.]|uniref:hypothetical protein n=1 Tax=Tateyamaria sp. TaxID=1929288 RepID=UPI00328FBB5A
MNKSFEINESAAIITVIAMQLVTVFAPGNMDAMDFLISSVCFIFAVNCLSLKHNSGFTKFVLAVNLALSSTYTIIIPLGFLYFWYAESLGFPTMPVEFGTHQPLSAYSFKVDLPRGWATEVELEDAIALALVPVMIAIVTLQQRTRLTK